MKVWLVIFQHDDGTMHPCITAHTTKAKADKQVMKILSELGRDSRYWSHEVRDCKVD